VISNFSYQLTKETSNAFTTFVLSRHPHSHHHSDCVIRALDAFNFHQTQAPEALTQKGESLNKMEQQFAENCRGYIHPPLVSSGIAGEVGFS
jgi:hypothetical protein